MKSSHPRLDELADKFGWSRGMPSETGVIAADKEARTTVNGREVMFSCYRYRREGLRWGCGAFWSAAMPRKQRKRAKKRSAELIALWLDPAARPVLQRSLGHSDLARIEDGFHVGTGGLGYGAMGEPPPADTVAENANLLTEMAIKIESFLEASS